MDVATGEVQRGSHERWIYRWRSVKMGKMVGYGGGKLQIWTYELLRYGWKNAKMVKMNRLMDGTDWGSTNIHRWKMGIWMETYKDDKNGWTHGSHRLENYKNDHLKD